MPEWRKKGIVLSVKKNGEKGIKANVLTLEHGRHLGWITNHNKKKHSFSCTAWKFSRYFLEI